MQVIFNLKYLTLQKPINFDALLFFSCDIEVDATAAIRLYEASGNSLVTSGMG